MSDPGKEPPVDALDAVCKQYKDCLKCARMEYGEQCIGEFQRYSYKIFRAGPNKGEVKCNNNPKKDELQGCKRKLCECDAMFAKLHVASKERFDFFSKLDFRLSIGSEMKIKNSAGEACHAIPGEQGSVSQGLLD